jgi:flagellar operon protein
MEKLTNYNRFSPIVIGTPNVNTSSTQKQATNPNGADFKRILMEQLNASSGVAFSKHAVSRAVDRNADLSENSLTRLNDGVRLAEERGLAEPLILIDSTAYIVNIKNNTVITTVANDDLKGSVFTNIDGTVII